MVIIKANNRCPIPVANPMVIAKKTLNISLLVPGKLLNLTKLNAPIIATDVPKFPFTIIIIVSTNNGKIEIVTKKFLLYLDVCLWVRAIKIPKIIDVIEHTKIDEISIDEVELEKILLSIYIIIPFF